MDLLDIIIILNFVWKETLRPFNRVVSNLGVSTGLHDD